MDDKTSIYMVMIVGIVAFVGIVVMIMNQMTVSSIQSTSNEITGNVISDTAFGMPSINAFGKMFFIMIMIGVASYMYFRQDSTDNKSSESLKDHYD